MTSENIEKFLTEKANAECLIRIVFKKRNTISGFFIATPDFNDLKVKNFWRVVSQSNYEQWKSSKDFNLSRLFNGKDFSKLCLQC